MCSSRSPDPTRTAIELNPTQAGGPRAIATFRSFRNTDPPALADLWNRATPDRGIVRPLTAHEFDALAIGRVGFERDGLIVAEEIDGDRCRMVGFAHAGFGPSEPRGPSHRLDTTMGTVAMLLIQPERDDPELEVGLFREAERFLRSRGAKVIYAGGQPPLDPFYRGLYGGSEFAGVLDSHATFVRAALRAGYEPVAKTILLEADLSRPEPRDPKAPLLRRQSRLVITDDARMPGWWDAQALGLFRPSRFQLVERSVNAPIANAWTWEIAGGYGVGDGKSRTGLIDLEVTPDYRRKGFGRHFVAEIMRRVREQNTDVISTQTSAENLPALGLYASLGFDPVDSATLYRLPAG